MFFYTFSPVLEERNQTFNLTVIRSLGVFGDVYCFYFLNQLTASVNDFYVKGVMNGGPSKLVFKNGEYLANITVVIYDDLITEDLEQFEIGLTIQNAVGNGGVSIGSHNRTVITIDANDGASGVFQFSSKSSESVTLRESDGISTSKTSHNFRVERKLGRYGDVKVMWQIVNASEAIYDVFPLSGNLTFGNLDKLRSFQINIVEDDIPELEKVLYVQLKIVSG